MTGVRAHPEASDGESATPAEGKQGQQGDGVAEEDQEGEDDGEDVGTRGEQQERSRDAVGREIPGDAEESRQRQLQGAEGQERGQRHLPAPAQGRGKDGREEGLPTTSPWGRADAR